jgi:hypothetical protein
VRRWAGGVTGLDSVMILLTVPLAARR